jgi:signal peptidase I
LGDIDIIGVMKKFFSAVWETIQVAVIALVVVLVVRNFLIQPFFVQGSSMVPNFNDGDYLIIDELTYRFREPERGEVVVFLFPQNKSNYFIKRIIGLPNEKILIKEGKIVIHNNQYLDGLVLNEEYISSQTPGDIEISLKENEYFMLGDNRYLSYDSRSWGVLLEENIIGLARFRLWPINDVKAFNVPEYVY